jgi:hypothetical protein
MLFHSSYFDVKLFNKLAVEIVSSYLVCYLTLEIRLQQINTMETRYLPMSDILEGFLVTW